MRSSTRDRPRSRCRLPPRGLILLEVSDDGVGIDMRQAGGAVRAGHVGLALVRRRVEDAGGVFTISTQDDGGNYTRVTLPDVDDGCGSLA